MSRWGRTTAWGGVSRRLAGGGPGARQQRTALSPLLVIRDRTFETVYLVFGTIVQGSDSKGLGMSAETARKECVRHGRSVNTHVCRVDSQIDARLNKT